MRIICEFEFQGQLVLPVHYNQMLQGFIYRNISDKTLSGFMHDVGFTNGKRSYKLFTYSKIFGKFSLDRERGQILFESPVELHIASPIEDFMSDLSSSLFRSENLELNGHKLELIKMGKVNYSFNEREYVINMLSPLVIYSTVEEQGKKRNLFYSPQDEVFSEKIRDNAIRKYKALYSKLPEDDELRLDYCSRNEARPVVIKYRNTIIKGYIGRYRIYGNPELISLLHSAGIGSKNSQGFGCFEVLES